VGCFGGCGLLDGWLLLLSGFVSFHFRVLGGKAGLFCFVELFLFFLPRVEIKLLLIPPSDLPSYTHFFYLAHWLGYKSERA
jgi:hypothetical protein